MSTVEDLKCARSDVLDAFAALETTVSRMIGKHGLELCARATLQQKLERLKELRPNPKLSRKRHEEILGGVDAASALLALRNDLVHAECRPIPIEPAVALYRNASSTWPDSTSVRCLSLDDHLRLREQVQRLADALDD